MTLIQTTMTMALPATALAGLILMCGAYYPNPHEDTAERLRTAAMEAAEGGSRADEAIATLRAAGPEGLEVFLAEHEKTLAGSASPFELMFGASPRESSSETDGVSAALDKICAQKDCASSRLFWFTDFDQAVAEAQATGKPILSLRLLGRLDEEFSCANSRFFRTTLYSNTEVADYLRSHYVLHWKSVRPAPKVTVDFGDGRKLHRTITGNSIHYVLDVDGRPVQALPGLYGPRPFLSELKKANELARDVQLAANGRERLETVRAFHRRETLAALAAWDADLRKVDSDFAATPALAKLENPRDVAAAVDVLGGHTSEADWNAIAALHRADATLDAGARSLIRSRHPDARTAGRMAATKMVVEDPMLKLFFNLEKSIALDSIQNRYRMQPRIAARMLSNDFARVDDLNEWVYARVFLTPDTDPWLGLTTAFSALDGDGRE